MNEAVAEASSPLLTLANIESAYGQVRAVRGVTLRVKPGEVVAVLGSNGAGKSTLLKTISGVLDPVRGKVTFKGVDITAREPAAIVRMGLSHVPEGREVFPRLSVSDNLLMGAYTRKDREGAARDLESVYAYFPVLRERLKQPAGLLSGGQQQMLAISRALMADPDLILLDEPSLGLSPKLTKEIFEIVVRINRERGVTILLVEQNANMALNAADHGYIMENGRIVLEDSCARLRARDDIRKFYLGTESAGPRGERRPGRKRAWR
jgi:branched-chain amino acid transport system ATP-binding protein